MHHKKLLLIILDGWGLAPSGAYNGIYLAQTPFFDRALAHNPHTKLAASGVAVGLLAGQMGSSEVGHMAIGAGRIVPQELTKLETALGNGSFYTNAAFVNAATRVKLNGGALHLVGIVSDGGVHSHEKHLHALLKIAHKEGVERVFVHAFTDGRDTSPQSAKVYLDRLQMMIDAINPAYRIATVCGRFYLDRNNN